MKSIKVLAISLLMFSTTAFASRDSIAFFYSPKKVNILINERSSEGRIQEMMDKFAVTDSLYLINKDEDVKFGCARVDIRATCTFTFYPGSNVEFLDKEILFTQSLENFGITENVDNFEIQFRSSMKDQMNLKVENGVLYIYGAKK